MFFHSTRGVDKDKTFADILMQGLASDGGLFMPDTWPQVEIEKLIYGFYLISLIK